VPDVHLTDPESTIEMCLVEASSTRDKNLSRVREIGRRARVKYGSNVEVLLAVARMYLRRSALDDAHATLTQLVRLSPGEVRTFVLMGETLLRKGDARRAVVAFDQADELGVADPQVSSMQTEAKSLVEVQEQEGERVAAERAIAMLGGTSISGRAAADLSAVSPDIPKAPRLPPDEAFGGVSSFDGLPGGFNPRSAPPPMTSDPPSRTQYSLIPGREGDSPRRRRLAPARGSARPRIPSSNSHSALPHSVPPHSVPPHSVPPHSVPPHSAPPHSVPPHSAPPHSVPPHSAPPHSVPPQSSPPGSNPPRTATERSAPPSAAGLASVALGRHDWPPRSSAPLSSPPSARPPLRDRSIPRWAMALGGVVALVGVALVGVEVGRGLATDEGGSADALTSEAKELLQTGSVSSLDRAEEALRRAREVDPASKTVARLALRSRVLHVLDAGQAPTTVATPLAQARKVGLSESDVAFALLAEMLDSPSRSGVTDALAQHDGSNAKRRGDDAMYQLVAGELLSRLGQPGAVDRYRAALKAEPRLFTARARLILTLLLGDGRDEALELLSALTKEYAGRAELDALHVVATRRGDRGKHQARLRAVEKVLDDLPMSLKSVTRALVAAGRADAGGARKAELAAAVAEAQTPAVLVLSGEVAVAVGDSETAQYAAQRALEAAPDFVPAQVLATRGLIAAGKLIEARSTIPKLDPISAAAVRSWLAYENCDLIGLRVAIEPLKQGTPGRAVAELAVERLLGARRLEPAELDRGIDEDPLWGGLIAIDATMDAGDLERARALSLPWRADPSPIQAIRMARLLRYEDRLDDARALLKTAPTTEGALIEGLLLAQSRKERQRLLSEASDARHDERQWLRVYVLAKDKRFAPALATVARLGVPNQDASLTVRTSAALSFVAMSDKKRARAVLGPLMATFPDNIDVEHAAVGAGMRRPRKR